MIGLLRLRARRFQYFYVNSHKINKLYHGKAFQKTHYFVSWSDSTSEKMVCAFFPKSNLCMLYGMEWFSTERRTISTLFCFITGLRSIIGLQTSHHFLNKWKIKLKPIVTFVAALVFLWFTPASFICFELWLLLHCAVCVNLDYFWFYDTKLKAALYATHQAPLNEDHDLEFRGWFISVAVYRGHIVVAFANSVSFAVNLIKTYRF